MKHPDAIAVVFRESRSDPAWATRKAGWYWAYGENFTSSTGAEIVEYGEDHGPYNSSAEAMMWALVDIKTSS